MSIFLKNIFFKRKIILQPPHVYENNPGGYQRCGYCDVLYARSTHFTRCPVFKRNRAIARENTEKHGVVFPIALKDECPRCYARESNHNCPF